LYPTLFAAGAVAIEARLRGAFAKTVPVLAIAISGIVLAPLAVPVLSEARYIAYAAALGLNPAAGRSRQSGILWTQLRRVRSDRRIRTQFGVAPGYR